MPNTNVDVPRWLGPLFMVAGLAIMALGAGLIPSPPESFHAPRWLVAVCGLVFLASGFRVQVVNRPEYSRWGSLVLVGCFAVIGLWIGFYGKAEAFGGGSEMLSAEQNVSAARYIFGTAGAGCAILVAFMVYNFKTLR